MFHLPTDGTWSRGVLFDSNSTVQFYSANQPCWFRSSILSYHIYQTKGHAVVLRVQLEILSVRWKPHTAMTVCIHCITSGGRSAKQCSQYIPSILYLKGVFLPTCFTWLKVIQCFKGTTVIGVIGFLWWRWWNRFRCRWEAVWGPGFFFITISIMMVPHRSTLSTWTTRGFWNPVE